MHLSGQGHSDLVVHRLDPVFEVSLILTTYRTWYPMWTLLNLRINAWSVNLRCSFNKMKINAWSQNYHSIVLASGVLVRNLLFGHNLNFYFIDFPSMNVCFKKCSCDFFVYIDNPRHGLSKFTREKGIRHKPFPYKNMCILNWNTSTPLRSHTPSFFIVHLRIKKWYNGLILNKSWNDFKNFLFIVSSTYF